METNILVVEDNKIHRRMLVDTIKESLVFYDVKAVGTAFAAINHLKKNKVGLLVLDLNLGDDKSVQGGFEVLEKINRDLPGAAVIVFTGHGSVEVCRKALSNNANEFIQKPEHEPLTKEYIRNQLLPTMLKLLSTLSATQWDKQKAILRGYSENQLIDKILIPLLVGMGFQNVERVSFHGLGELGKDIKPFFLTGPFGEKIFYAAQVKAGDVDSTAGSKNGVNKLIDQVEKVLFTKFVDQTENLKRTVDKAMAIISGDFRGESAQIFNDKFEGKANVLWIDGNRLLNLINKHRLSNLLFSFSPVKLQKITLKETDKNIFAFMQVKGRPSKSELMEQVVGFLAKKKMLSPKHRALEKLLRRELLGSTGPGGGGALPHTILKLKKTILVICIIDQGVDWDALDEKECNVVCFLLASSKLNKLKSLVFLSKFQRSAGSYKDFQKKKNYIYKEIAKRCR
ncbi:MAG: response regulator [Candidatus Omnitrophica bacterium]|nr:response regulator [Candidatus Omnitrophota bacterium]